MKMRLFFVAALGNLLEYYDYALYGFLAPVLAPYFFPQVPTVAGSILAIFAVFSLGSFAKPLGAFLFSHIGDRRGRKKALKGSILGMGIVSLLIAITPSAEIIGDGALVILILLRFLQGFFLGGEADASRLYIIEHMSSRFAALANGIAGAISFIGIFLASLVSQWPSLWKWFFGIGGILSLSLFFLRRSMSETPPFLEAQLSPILGFRSIMRFHRRLLVSAVFLSGASGGLYQLFFVFGPTYWGTLTHTLSPQDAAQWGSWGILSLTLMLPLAGLLSDRWSYVKTLTLGIILMGGGWIKILYDNSLQRASLGTVLFMGVASAFYMVPVFPMILKEIPVRSRFRILAIGHTLGSMIFSGTAPMVATSLGNKAFFYGGLFLGLAVAGLFFLIHADAPRKMPQAQ